MITLKLGDKTFEIKGNMVTQCEKAAPAMDRILHRVASKREGDFTVATVETAADMLEALAPFIEGETRESLMAVASFRDIAAIGEAYVSHMQYVGLFAPPAIFDDAPAAEAVAA